MAGDRKSWLYQTNRRLVFQEENHCALCGQWVDKSIPYRNPITGLVNRMSKSCDHIVPEQAGGTDERDNLQLAHLHCNQRKGADHGTERQERPDPKAIGRNSRDW